MAKPGPKPPYRQLMFELHIPRSDRNSDHHSTTVFVHLLDETTEDKKQVGGALVANGLHELPAVIERLLRERRGLVIEDDEIRPRAGAALQ
jgi:hypothetical protein